MVHHRTKKNFNVETSDSRTAEECNEGGIQQNSREELGKPILRIEISCQETLPVTGDPNNIQLLLDEIRNDVREIRKKIPTGNSQSTLNYT